VILGPFAEEVLFRGFLFNQLRRRWSLGWAIGVSSLAFGLSHVLWIGLDTLWYLATGWSDVSHLWDAVWQAAGTWFQSNLLEVVVTTLAGVLFAIVSWRFGRLWPAIGLHACMNLWWTLAHGEGVRVAIRPDASAVAQGVSIALALALAYWRPAPMRALAERHAS
jgi:membrane protease YdiL (CAAX protease family)